MHRSFDARNAPQDDKEFGIRQDVHVVWLKASREAAQECSPERKPWVKQSNDQAPQGRKKIRRYRQNTTPITSAT
jgi:hypothetical protein